MNLLSSLRYLVALNEHRHFGRAAQACHITQPALSNALRALESEFNVVIVKRDRKASTSYIQRRLQIGYNRAASLMERMELEGIVGQANHAGKREILVEEEEGRF